MGSPGKDTKRITHSIERARERDIVRDILGHIIEE